MIDFIVKAMRTNWKKGLLTVAVMALLGIDAAAQSPLRLYDVRQGGVFYRGIRVRGADAQSFVELGFGYAKDRHRVYMNGRQLPYVDPDGFSLVDVSGFDKYGLDYPDIDDGPAWDKESCSGYIKTSHNVLYHGRVLAGASASSFVDLGWGYAKDSFNAYYKGRKIDASAGALKVLGGGYAKDSFAVFYLGNKVNGASVNSFKYLGKGYAEDNFSTYYRGAKVE